MTLSELHAKLIQAYSIHNLNKISLTLLNLYKEEQFGILRKIVERMEAKVSIPISDEGKGFSKLMMLYHPDRAAFHIAEINKYKEQNDYNALLGYSHILELENVEEMASGLEAYDDIDYSPVYEWDIKMSGFRVFSDIDPLKRNVKRKSGLSFYDAFKIRQYGHTKIEFPSYYLEDIEKIELSSSDIDDLDGVQFCIHSKSIDLSDNKIFDLSYLSGLKQLKKLNLSGNQINYVDALCTLSSLKSVDLSDNQITDISPLYDLDNLKYVSLRGNHVDPSQIEELIEYGVEVDV